MALQHEHSTLSIYILVGFLAGTYVWHTSHSACEMHKTSQEQFQLTGAKVREMWVDRSVIHVLMHLWSSYAWVCDPIREVLVTCHHLFRPAVSPLCDEDCTKSPFCDDRMHESGIQFARCWWHVIICFCALQCHLCVMKNALKARSLASSLPPCTPLPHQELVCFSGNTISMLTCVSKANMMLCQKNKQFLAFKAISRSQGHASLWNCCPLLRALKSSYSLRQINEHCNSLQDNSASLYIVNSSMSCLHRNSWALFSLTIEFTMLYSILFALGVQALRVEGCTDRWRCQCAYHVLF